ncbi:MAG: hypothetical protein R6V62_07115, partial [Candidatus Fermentibacteraceae bacterium]
MIAILVIAAALPVLPTSGSFLTPFSSPSTPPSTDDPDVCEGWPVSFNTPGGGFPYTPTLYDINGDGAL